MSSVLSALRRRVNGRPVRYASPSHGEFRISAFTGFYGGKARGHRAIRAVYAEHERSGTAIANRDFRCIAEKTRRDVAYDKRRHG